MNDRDRSAWAKALGSALLPSPTGESGLIVIPGKVPSKANQHEIRFHPHFWRQIEMIARIWKKKFPNSSPYWIAPSEAVKNYQQFVAQHVTMSEKFMFEGDLELSVALYGQRIDFDNIKVIPDAIQQSGIIKNDSQVTRGIIEKHAGEPRVEIRMKKRP